MEYILPLVQTLAAKYPMVMAVLTFVGTARLVMKPIMSALKEIAAATPTDKDDLLVKKVEDSKAYKFIQYVLDWTLSIKLK